LTTQRASIDWPRLLGDIAYLIGEEVPGSCAREPVGSRLLAAYLGVSRGALRNWQDGTEPRHSEGEQLIETWCRLCGKPEASAPITVRSLSASRA